MTITLHWWYLPIVLFVIPIIYVNVREPSSQWDFQIDSMLVAAICWMAAVGILIGHFI